MRTKQNLQILATLVGVVLGVVVGVALRGAGLNREQLRYLALPGKLFLRALQMLVLPIIVTSVVCGFASLKGTSKGKLLGKTLFFYLTSSMLASLTGEWAIKPSFFWNRPRRKQNVAAFVSERCHFQFHGARQFTKAPRFLLAVQMNSCFRTSSRVFHFKQGKVLRTEHFIWFCE